MSHFLDLKNQRRLADYLWRHTLQGGAHLEAARDLEDLRTPELLSAHLQLIERRDDAVHFLERLHGLNRPTN